MASRSLEYIQQIKEHGFQQQDEKLLKLLLLLKKEVEALEDENQRLKAEANWHRFPDNFGRW